MTNQLTSNAEALRLFFTEDIYLVNNEVKDAFVEPLKEVQGVLQAGNIVLPQTEVKIDDQQIVDLSITTEIKVEAKAKFDFKYLGKNQQNILILVNDRDNEVSTEQGRELLRKLVNAIALTAKDFALINYANYTTATYADFNAVLKCKLVLAFGVFPKQLGLAEQRMHELKEVGETKFIFTTNLHDLDRDQTSKKILWSNLQKLK